MIEDLKEHLANYPEKDWSAGQQLEALKFYLKVPILAEYREGGYQGGVGAILFTKNKYFLWRDSFGSCSGCDGLEGKDGFEYIQRTLTSVKEFNSLKEVYDYLKSEEIDYLYNELSSGLISSIDEFMILNNLNLNMDNAEIYSKINKILVLGGLDENKRD